MQSLSFTPRVTDTAPTPLYSLARGRVNYQRILSVGVTVRTVGFTPHVFPDYSTMTILSLRHRFKMLRVNAQRNSAEMIDLKPNWNWPDKMFIRPSMSLGFLVGIMEPAIAGASRLNRISRPNPARPEVGAIFRDWPLFVDSRPKEDIFADCFTVISHVGSVPCFEITR